MKKIIIILILLLGFMYTPVFAEELPTEGVTYFFTYPDKSEDVTEEYNKAVNPEEKLIYSGYTDNNGEIPLCGWEKFGNIRVVQHVPEGYTTNQREIRLDLSKNIEANFVNYRGLSNPETGRTIIYVIAVIAMVISITLAISKFGVRKTLFVLPLFVALFISYKVDAFVSCVSVSVKDGKGNPLSNVQIEIYATPKVEASPAVIFSSNGGTFFDGKTKMYFKLPGDRVSKDDFFNSLDVDLYDYWNDNSFNAYRDGYWPGDYEWPELDFYNGLDIKLNWNRDSSAHLMMIDGNGGYYPYFGQKLKQIVVYQGDYGISDLTEEFIHDEKHYIGFDVTNSCSSFNDFGVIPGEFKINDFDGEVYYVCWHNRPDGIYINDSKVIVGNISGCFDYAVDDVNHDYYQFGYNGEGSNDVFVINFGDPNNIGLYYQSRSSNSNDIQLKWQDSFLDECSKSIDKIEIINDGEVVFTINSSDITREDNCNYYISNQNKASQLLDYITRLSNNGCILQTMPWE